MDTVQRKRHASTETKFHTFISSVSALFSSQLTASLQLQLLQVVLRLMSKNVLDFSNTEGVHDIVSYLREQEHQLEVRKACGVISRNSTAILSLDFYIGGEGSLAICQSMAHNTSLHTLVLDSNYIGDVGAQSLAENLCNNHTLASLTLHANGIGPKGARSLSNWLSTNTALTSLNLDYNNLEDQGCCAIAEGVSSNTTLLCLDLSRNAIGVEGEKAIGLMLATNKTLVRLSLHENQIGGEELCWGLSVNSRLEWLDITYNQIKVAGAAALSDMLKVNTHLRALQCLLLLPTATTL